MQKVFRVTVDISKKIPAPAFEVNTNDLKSVKLEITITNGLSLLDLTGVTPRINIRKPDNEVIFQDCEIVDATAGKVEIILENQAYLVPGTHTAEIACYKGNEITAITGTFSYKSVKGIMNDEAVESKSEFTAINRTIQEAERILEDLRENGGGGGAGVDQQARQKIEEVTTRLADTSQEVINMQKNFLKPYFIEYFGSFSRYGLGQPSGIANYPGGNFTLGVSGNAGDRFLTIKNGNIAHAGGKWPCVIKNDDGLYDLNKVMSTEGSNKINLFSPLKKNITNGILANLQDSAQGQHYTEHGYFAFAQHLYFSNPRYTERNNVLAQFMPYDTGGKWVSNSGSITYNANANMNDTDDLLVSVGSKHLSVYMSDATKYVEWEENLNGYKGYVETYLGSSPGKSKVEFFLDDILVDSIEVSRPVQRVIFPFEYAKKGKIRISVIEGFPYGLRIGRTTWFSNEKYSKTRLLNPSDKVVFMGDSWGEFHNKAVTRELERLMKADGGSPLLFNYSKGGHTSDYARAWFNEYVIKNKPDKVIIEYFTNDFNSIRGTVLPTFTAPDGTQKDMNIANLSEYVANIQWMVDKAIENGIQPIVVMPASTNSLTQAQAAANYTVDLWNGTKTTNDTPYFQSATLGKTVTNEIEANGSSDIIIKGKAQNSSGRRGVIVDSDTNLTGGSIQRWRNNGVDKAGIRHNGAMEMPAVMLQPHTYSFAGLDANGRGNMYLLEQSGQDDILYLVVKKADGTFARKKIQLID